MFPNLEIVGWYSTGSEHKSDNPDHIKDMAI